MTLLLIGGSAFVIYKIADFNPKSKSVLPVQSEFLLKFPENIETVMACGDQFCLMTVGHESGRRLIIVDPNTGRTKAVLTFKEK